MTHSNSMLRQLARAGLLGALALHLCGAALGPWAHATSVFHGDPRAEEFHPGDPHLEGVGSGHPPCALCLTVGQPSLAAPLPSTLQWLTVEIASPRADGRIPPPRRDLRVRARGPPPLWLDPTQRA